MADSVSGPVSESVAKPGSESVAESKSNSVPGSPSAPTDDFTDKNDSNPFSALFPEQVWSHSSSLPVPDSNIVCATCAQLSWEQLCTPEGQRYHGSWTALVENANQGCRLCTFFVNVKGPSWYRTSKIPWQSGPLFLRIHDTNLDLFDSDSSISWRYGLCLPADIDEPLPERAKNINNKLQYPDRACEKAIGKIQTWINECETAHPNCRKPVISSMPSRVLDLFHNDSAQSIRLVEGKGLKAEYATLSYCWGKEAENANGQISTCTSQNISRLFQGFSIDELPPVYRDAVIMTQKLGKRFLWIDSLCIIQDSKEDWAKECPRMADIYANSFLTIAATFCRNKQEGFIKTTKFETQAKLVTIPGTRSQYIYVRPFLCADSDKPLMDRAWAFQERVLSIRVLHLTSLEMVFQCDCHQSDGCGSTFCLTHSLGQKSFFWTLSWPLFEVCDPRDVKDVWYQVVENYTHLQLSYEKDRLPALSSIAHLIQQHFLLQDGLKANYMAGLWEHDLAYGLLWSMYDSVKTDAKGLSQYVAPTWSWGSVPGEFIQMSHSSCRGFLELEVVDVQAHLSTSNPFGEISSAYLTIDAPIQRAFSRDIQTCKDVGCFGTNHKLVDDFVEIFFGLDMIGDFKISTFEAIWLLPCMKDAVLEENQLANKQIGIGGHWDGLALELVDEKKQVYKRIGVFVFRRLFGEKRTWHDLGFVDMRVTII